MERNIEAAIKILDNEDHLRAAELKKCHGIVVMAAAEVGFLFSAQIGTGILLRHDNEKNIWGPPLAVGLSGVGVGISLGAEKKDMIIILPEEQMTKAFTSDFSFRIGLDHSWAIGVGQGAKDKNISSKNVSEQCYSIEFIETLWIC